MAWWRSKTTSPASAKSADDEGDRSDLEPATQRIGLEILQSARAHRDGRFSRRFWSDQLMQWSMKDPAFKTQLFRFIDAFPMLRTPEQIRSHLLEYLMQPGVTLPAGMSLGLKAGAIFQGTLASTIGGQIQSMAEKFILAESAAAALPKLRGLWDQSIAFSVDLLGEACVSDAEAAEYQRRYLELIEVLAEQTRDWPANPVLETNHLGAIPRANVSVKISSLSARIKPADTEGSVERLMETLRPILQAAQKHSVFVNFDIEQHSLKELTLALFRRCCEAIDFPAGLALQAYLCGGDEDAAALIEWAKSAGRQITVRLVKGAYWDYEVVQAEMMGWPAPVWTSKVETDACFERMAGQFLAATPRDPGQGGILLALGSHNVRSIAAALAQLHAHGLPPNAIEIQMLHGMADELKGALVEQGLRLREYAPVGEMIPGMAYLVRRLLENTSNESWLRAGFASDADPAELLAAPNTDGVTPPTSHDGAAAAYDRAAAARQHRLSPAADDLGDGLPFLNEPLRDFSDAGQRARFAEAIGAASVPAVANDSTVDQARTAVGRAVENFPTWRDTAAPERRAIIVNAAAIMRRRRDELCGIIIRESGKTWSEADADVCEAIDFCEYYARQAVGLFAPTRLGRFVGEHNLQWHEPRGVAAIISPWNFPLSISTGMTVAALVTGNCAILKPAEQTPAIARVLCEILWQAGIPRDVLQFLPGRGETVGAALVRDPGIALIAFTGSKAVGLDILRAAGDTPEDQPFIKQVVCEMGGKNAIIIDASADLDEAVLAVRQSAFSFSGQKCSAASRVVVLDAVHDTFLRRLVEATGALTIGDPLDPATDIGPVIDAEAADKIRRYIEIGKGEGKLELGSPPAAVPAGLEDRLGKPVIGPHIFSGIQSHHRLAREEVFGPVLAVMRARDFGEALAIANGSEYKLTGGVFSRTPSHLEQARREFRVGNLYLNRGITGALVARQPFGGFALSGRGSKAGGDEYLLHFVIPRVSTENTLRRGFAPASTAGE